MVRQIKQNIKGSKILLDRNSPRKKTIETKDSEKEN